MQSQFFGALLRMSIQDIIADDITDVLTVEANTPLSAQAVYTPIGGAAQTAITVLYANTPLHGDEQQNYQVGQEEIMIAAKTADVSAWEINGTVTINSFDYEVAMAAYPTDGYWSMIALRTPRLNKTKI